MSIARLLLLAFVGSLITPWLAFAHNPEASTNQLSNYNTTDVLVAEEHSGCADGCNDPGNGTQTPCDITCQLQRCGKCHYFPFFLPIFPSPVDFSLEWQPLITIEKKSLLQANRYYKATLDEYGRGLKNSPDVAGASTLVADARARLLATAYEWHVQKIEHEKALGKTVQSVLEDKHGE